MVLLCPGSLCPEGHPGTGPAVAAGIPGWKASSPEFRPRPRPINLIEHDDGKTVAFSTGSRRRQVTLHSVPGGVRAEHRRSLRSEDQPGKQRLEMHRKSSSLGRLGARTLCGRLVFPGMEVIFQCACWDAGMTWWSFQRLREELARLEHSTDVSRRRDEKLQNRRGNHAKSLSADHLSCRAASLLSDDTAWGGLADLYRVACKSGLRGYTLVPVAGHRLKLP